MAAKSDSKFGTFGGVFTPSILTILGVIMYLRLPWVVGNAGLMLSFGIILAAHVVSVCTGLSISSIATDKSVGAGGPYYIISRSLGLPIGGTLGLALFLGLSFSISLYVIGFSESFLATLGVGISPGAIRVCGTITIILLTIITFISTSLAIKTQYLILALIAASLVSIFFGSPPSDPTGPLIGAPEGGADLSQLFGIFFPAVTGFTAGVNMSGDLKDAKKSIPTGTMASILVGLIVYLSLAFYLAVRVPRAQLVDNPRVLEDLSVWAPAVTAGVWGATLSSALGSILGAPRILQTVSSDGITPRWFAKGYGKTNEPRNALLLAFAIGEAGILIAELDVIARVVSMVFMATYGFLNAAAAIESWVSPDFRPEFRIPNTISVIGAAASVLLMVVMDLPAMAGATVMMAGLFVYLQRRQLQLESGDAWEGIWSSLVRAGLHRLARGDRQHRNWRPNILLFRPDDGQEREALRRTAASLITGNGMLTDVRLRSPADKREPGPGPHEPLLETGPVVGVFSKAIVTDDPVSTIESVSQFHGYSGVEPNTVLLDWDAHAGDPDRLGRLIDRLREHDLNVLLFSDTTHQPPAGSQPRVDVWWRAQSTPALGIALIRFITGSPEFRHAEIRFRTVSRDSSIDDGLRNAARRMLRAARVQAEVEVVLDMVEPRAVEDHVMERSSDALLAIVELPPSPVGPHLEELAEVSASVPSILYVAPSSMFQQAGRVVRAPTAELAQDAEVAAEQAQRLDLPPLRLPPVAELEQAGAAFAERLERTLAELFDQSLLRVGERNAALLERAQALVERHFKMLHDGLGAGNPVKQRRTVNRVQSAFLLECGKLIDEFVQQDLADQHDILEGRLLALCEDVSLVIPDETLEVARPRDDFAPSPGDSREVARLKSWRRMNARGDTVRYSLSTGRLQDYYVEAASSEVVADVVRAFVTDCWNLAVQLGRVFNSSRTSLTLIHGDPAVDSDEALRTFVGKERERAIDRVSELARLQQNRLQEQRQRLMIEARRLSQAYADDLERVDFEHHVRTRRRPPRHREARRAALLELPDVFFDNQRALFDRAQIGLKVSAFQHRLATIVQRTEEALALEVKNGVLHGLEDLHEQLERHLESPPERPLKVKLDVSHRFDPQKAIDGLLREGQRSAEELPELTSTLSDASIQALAEGDAEGVEMTDLPLRRLAQFLLEAELVGPLTELLSTVPQMEEKAVGVGEDVARLIGFHQSEYDPTDQAPEPAEEQSFEEHMKPVIRNGLERVDREIGPLREIVPTVRELLDAKLAAVLRGTDVYELTGSAQALGQHIRRRQGQRAVSGAQSLLIQGADRVRRALVGAVYGRSAGLLMARRLRETAAPGGALVDRVLGFVLENSPDAGVLEDLPFYYRQLFFGKNTFNETFWVERELELSRARRGIAQHARGARGVLIVTGEPDSGKTALCRRLTSRALSQRQIHWVSPPDEGSAEPEVFRQRLAEVTGGRGSPLDMLAEVPDRAVVVLEDLELWWERSPHGLAVIDEILTCVEAHAGRLLFLMDVGSQPFRLINGFRQLADHALAVVECGPLPAEALKEIVMLRHGSTGVGFELDGVAEPELSDWRLARLFSQHFTYSRGLVGAALTSWITHVDQADERTIVVRAPVRTGWEVLDGLRAEWVAILVQLLLHKRLTRQRLLRISGLDARDLDHQLDALRRMGLVRESRQGVLRLDRFVTHVLTERLRERKVIP